jgi:hypothetical protein
MTLNKRRGLPPGSKNKAKASLPEKKFPKQGVEERDKQNIINENNRLLDKIEDLEERLADSQYQAIGFRAVIKYLQDRVDGNLKL